MRWWCCRSKRSLFGKNLSVLLPMSPGPRTLSILQRIDDNELRASTRVYLLSLMTPIRAKSSAYRITCPHSLGCSGGGFHRGLFSWCLEAMFHTVGRVSPLLITVFRLAISICSLVILHLKFSILAAFLDLPNSISCLWLIDGGYLHLFCYYYFMLVSGSWYSLVPLVNVYFSTLFAIMSVVPLT